LARGESLSLELLVCIVIFYNTLGGSYCIQMRTPDDNSRLHVLYIAAA